MTGFVMNFVFVYYSTVKNSDKKVQKVYKSATHKKEHWSFFFLDGVLRNPLESPRKEKEKKIQRSDKFLLLSFEIGSLFFLKPFDICKNKKKENKGFFRSKL